LLKLNIAILDPHARKKSEKSLASVA